MHGENGVSFQWSSLKGARAACAVQVPFPKMARVVIPELWASDDRWLAGKCRCSTSTFPASYTDMLVASTWHPSSGPAGVSAAARWAARGRTLMAMLCLWAFTPLLVIMALLAWMRHCVSRSRSEPCSPPKKLLRILVTGGKMTKACTVARVVGRAGHTVVTAEVMPYKFCHTRFSSYVSKHYILPRPTAHPQEWEQAVLAIVKEQQINLIIPCTAPVESSAYAHLRQRLPSHVRIFAFDGATCDVLDNKYTFSQALLCAGIPCPETVSMESTEDALAFFSHREGDEDGGKRFIVKPAVYNPMTRTELVLLPLEDKQRQWEYLLSRHASKEMPYVIQEQLLPSPSTAATPSTTAAS